MAGDDLDVLVVGAGFSGLYALYRLRESGFDVRLVEASDGLGGVWRNNRYPGARVDSHVPNYEYSLEAVWRDWYWTERFPGRDELCAYFEHVADVLDLRPDIEFNTAITSGRFDDERHMWDLGTSDGRTLATRHVLMCTGFASAPYTPDIPGLGSFSGELHHTAQWPAEGVEFGGRRVAVVGTGASAVQVVQEAAGVADHLTVFQRTPVTALPMQQQVLTREGQDEAKKQYPQRFARRNAGPGSFDDIERLDLTTFEATEEQRVAVYEEKWNLGGFHFWAGTFVDTLIDDDANRAAYEFWRDKTRARIDDPDLAELLAPTDPPYPFGTKRPSLEQGYYEAFNRPDVSLVDLKADPIVEITPTGIRTEHDSHEFDVIVMGTGFDANTGGLTSIDLRTSDGSTLAEQWEDGVSTQLGLAVPGLPNLLFLYGPQSATAFCNGPTCAELQGEWVNELLITMWDGGLTRIEATDDAAQAWTDHLQEFHDMTLFSKVDSWYVGTNIPGKRRQLLNHPSADAYREALASCRDDGYSGFVLTS